MIRDLDQSDAPPGVYDVCIVGSGPAGTTLACELADRGLSLCVLESGVRRPTKRGDARREVVSEGIRIKEYSRERVLGGASTTWAGLSAPLDSIDLGPRPELADAGAADPAQWRAGWPLSRDDLQPFWEAAAERYRFPPPTQFGGEGFGRLRGRGGPPPDWPGLDEKVFLACAEPQDFGRDFGEVYARDDVDLLLDATLLELQTAPGTDDPPDADHGAGATTGDTARGPGQHEGASGTARTRVRRAVVVTRSGRRVTVRARVFVLACGGLENARLLLASRDANPAGLGNEHDQVGRHLMNHPKNYHGVIRLAQPVRELPWLFGCLHGGFAGYAGLRLTDERLAQRGLLNSYVRFEPLFPWSGSPGVEALVTLVKHSGGFFKRWKRRRKDELVTLRDYSETGDDSDLQNARVTPWRAVKLAGLVLRHAVPVARYAWSRLREGRAPLIRRVRLRNFMEMEPHPEHRVSLHPTATDADGRPLPHVAHDTTALDRRSLVALHAALSEALERNGFGVLEGALTAAEAAGDWPIDQDASHHMGTTRMGRDPATSVTDSQGRVHTVDNLYVAGASLFPTSGCANPTYTLVALAIRLAAHLAEDVFGRERRPVLRAAPPPAVAVLDRAERAAAAGPDARGLLVIGAGRRVATDVLPALASLSDTWRVDGVFARTPRPLVSGPPGAQKGREGWEVSALESLTDADVAGAELIHLAVSKGAVPAVLQRLRRHDVSGVDLLIDTPVLLLKHLRHARLLDGFRRVWVAEDIVRLPWLDVVAASAARFGAPRELLCEHSAWRYHGLALARTLLGGGRIRSARRRAGERGDRVEYALDGGAQAVVLEPRDYARGRLVLRAEHGAWSDAPREGEDLAALEMLVDHGRVTGFRLGDAEAALLPEESALLGPALPGDTVTARTEGLKRVGLRRMLADIAAGRGGYPLATGLDDMVIDALLEKLRVWRPSPLTRADAAVFRGAMGALGRLAPGG